MKVKDLKTVYKIEGVPAKIKHGAKLYDLGTYTIRISKRRPKGDDIYDVISGVRIKREEENNLCWGHPHPHVDEYGTPCLGNLRSIIAGLLQVRDYSMAGELLVKFLNSYQHQSSFFEIGELDNEYCGTCHELTDDCTCSA